MTVYVSMRLIPSVSGDQLWCRHEGRQSGKTWRIWGLSGSILIYVTQKHVSRPDEDSGKNTFKAICTVIPAVAAVSRFTVRQNTNRYLDYI